MTFWLENNDGSIIDNYNYKELDEATTKVIITIGLHDRETVIMSIILNRLLMSLVPLHCN